MKKILNVLAVCLSAALFVTGCASPSTSSGNGGNNGTEPTFGTREWIDWIYAQEPSGKTFGDPEYDAWLAKTPTHNINNPYNCFLYGGPGIAEAVYFRINNLRHTDNIEMIIVENNDNITLNVETIWEDNDTEQWINQYGKVNDDTKNLNPNIYFKITADKYGTIKYYIKDTTVNFDFGYTRWHEQYPQDYIYTLNIKDPFMH